MNQSKKLKSILITVGALAIVFTAMLLIYQNFKPEPIKGSKEIGIDVVIPEQEPKAFTLKTDAEYLRQALEEANLIKGSESEFGLFISEVNGRIADTSKQEWWCITKAGAQINNGVDTIAIADGDHYEITLIQGY